MRITFTNALVATFLAVALLTPSFAADSDATEARMARMEARLVEMEARLAAAEKGPQPSSNNVSEARIVELEARLADAEQETKEVKVLAATSHAGASSSHILGNTATYDILANSAWRNLRWTNEEQWVDVRPGISMEKVIELLGSPPRSVDSVKPRVDEVFYYETSIRDRTNALRGKVSFRKGKVLTVEKPNFDKKT
ncbi:MAG: putative coiled-coil protein SlyX [Lentimonas sp.]|jgi:uncharacterized coiled-coil protein SlyX